jgi:hypothetical protein
MKMKLIEKIRNFQESLSDKSPKEAREAFRTFYGYGFHHLIHRELDIRMI